MDFFLILDIIGSNKVGVPRRLTSKRLAGDRWTDLNLNCEQVYCSDDR